MKKRGKEKDNFVETARDFLNSISSIKEELRSLKNEELRKINIKEKEEIKLVKERAKRNKQKVLERYEAKKENLGKILLKKKAQGLKDHLFLEKKSLSKTNREISKVKRNLKNVRK